jgi:ABC-type glycerol-3-phosphate transport system substrate-binding protein
MKKILNLILLILLCVSILFISVGCKTVIETEKKDGDEALVIPDLIIQPNATNTIKVATLLGQVESSTMILWANGYMRNNPDIQINIDSTMSGMGDVANWHSSGKMPDIVWTAGDQHSYYSKLGYFEDLRNYAIDADADFFGDFYTSLIDATHYSNKDEGIWFMPRDYNQLCFYVNKTLLTETGISIPDSSWTWTDLENICKAWKTAKPDDINFAIQADYAWNPLSVTMLENFDASIYNDSTLISTDSEKLKSCMEYLYDIINNKKWMVKNSGGFYTMDIPMMISVRPNLPLVVSQTTDYDVMALPLPQFTSADNGRGYVGVGCSGYAISSDSTPIQKDLAWKFLKYCMSADGYNEVGAYGSIVPALQSLSNSGKWINYKNGVGNTFDSTAFTGGLCDAISVNFCSNLQPISQSATAVQLIDYFNKLQYTSFDYLKSTQIFLSSIRNYN